MYAVAPSARVYKPNVPAVPNALANVAVIVPDASTATDEVNITAGVVSTC